MHSAGERPCVRGQPGERANKAGRRGLAAGVSEGSLEGPGGRGWAWRCEGNYGAHQIASRRCLRCHTAVVAHAHRFAV